MVGIKRTFINTDRQRKIMSIQEIIGFAGSLSGGLLGVTLYVQSRRKPEQRGLSGIYLFALILCSIGALGQIAQWIFMWSRR